jgi:hydroxymethylglutaryl-CoA reductase
LHRRKHQSLCQTHEHHVDLIGRSIHVKFTSETGSAAGQDMVTFATHAANQHFLQSPAGVQAGVVGFSIEGQVASDKKASWGNVFTPRGVEVIAWGTLTDEVCRTAFGVSTLQFYETITMGQDAGIRNGQFGSNCNAANVVAAMFIACGQDAASVLEGGWAQATAEYNHQTQELLISMYIPSLLVGTVGGGSGYSTQQEALKMLGYEGEGKKWALAETVAAFCLALDVSTTSAISNDTFAASHKVLARV